MPGPLSPLSPLSALSFPRHASFSGSVICDGNSLTEGTGSTGGQTYPAQLAALFASGLTVYNFGVGGQTAEAMESDASTQVDVLFDATKSVNVVSAWELRNSRLVVPDTNDAAVNAFILYCQHRRAAGFLVIALTCLPSQGLVESDRLYMNARVRSELATFADALADCGNDANIGQLNQHLDTTYYADQIHETNAGYGVTAGWAKAAFDGLYNTVAAPSGLGDSTTKPAVVLSWLPVQGANSYIVQRSTSSSGPWTTLSSAVTAVTLTGGRQKPTYSDDTSDDLPGTYYYRVASNTRGGTGAYTSAYTVAVPALSAPASPAAAKGDTQVTVSWSAVTYATGYKVYRSTTSGSGYTLAGSPSASPFVDTGLTNGTTYFYVINATDSGSVSPNSAEVSATPAANSLLVGLTAYWKFEEASGTRADATGRGNDLAATNAPAQVTGKQNFGAQIVAASSQKLAKTSTSDLQATIAWTVDGWVKFDSLAATSNNELVFGKWGTNSEYLLLLNESGGGSALRILAWDTAGGSLLVLNAGANAIATGHWYYFAVRFDGTTAKITCRSVTTSSGTGSNSTAWAHSVRQASNPFEIGMASPQLDGTVDEIGIWQRALTDAEVDRRYASGAGTTYPDF